MTCFYSTVINDDRYAKKLQNIYSIYQFDLQIKEKARALRLLRFTAAVLHHLCAIRIQRAVRGHWALVSAKRQMSVVLYIQVHLTATHALYDRLWFIHLT